MFKKYIKDIKYHKRGKARVDTKPRIMAGLSVVILLSMGSLSNVLGYQSAKSIPADDIPLLTTKNLEREMSTENNHLQISLIEEEIFLRFLNIGKQEDEIQKRNDRDEKYETTIFNFGTSSAYDYGIKAGHLLCPFYRILDFFCGFYEKRKIDTNSLKIYLDTLEKTFPLFLEELKGLSVSTNIDVEKLILIQSRLHTLLDDRCTITLSTGKATKNNETFLTFSIDSSVDGIRDIFLSCILHRIFCLKCWVLKLNTMKYQYAFWGIPVLYEYPFLNEKGLGMGSPGTVFTKNESRGIDEGPGIPTMILESEAMMTCKNVSEVATFFKNSERALQTENSWFNQYDGSSSSFCDKDGGILVMEQTHNYFIAVFGNSSEVTGGREGILWHTNHHLWLDPNLTGSVYPYEFPTSGFREERAHELLDLYYGNITLDVCKKISRDHGGGFDQNKMDSGDICRHPDNCSLKVTAFAWIVMPKDLSVYCTHTCPCRGVFWKCDFSKRFV